VAAEVVKALETVLRQPVDITAAGRTDRGVHALGQVVHFDTGADRPASAWVRGVNALLPESMAILWSRTVPEDFHARYSARARAYRAGKASRSPLGTRVPSRMRSVSSRQIASAIPSGSGVGVGAVQIEAQ